MYPSPYQTPEGISAADQVLDPEEMRAIAVGQRLNRLRMCCYYFTGSLIFGLLLAIGVVVSQALEPALVNLLLLAAMLFGLAMLVWMITLMVRRLHDCDRSGWWWLLSLVPLLNAFFWLYLLLAPGTPGVNSYGAANPPNSLLVNIFGGLFWLLSVLSFVANVVMLALLLLGGGASLESWFPLQGLEGYPG